MHLLACSREEPLPLYQPAGSVRRCMVLVVANSGFRVEPEAERQRPPDRGQFEFEVGILGTCAM